jgi:hypothetical protein
MLNADERNQFYLESFRLAQKEAAEAFAARERAQERLDRANAACMAWKTIAEQAGVEISAKNVQPQQQKATEPHVSSESEDAFVDISKAEFVRLSIERAGLNGTTPLEIKEAAVKAGIELYKGYPYTVIYKLKEHKKVRENEKGRLVLARAA